MCSFKLKGKKVYVWVIDRAIEPTNQSTTKRIKYPETLAKKHEKCYSDAIDQIPQRRFSQKAKNTFHVHVPSAAAYKHIEFHIHCDEMTLRKFESKHTWPFKKNSSDKAIVGQQRKNHSAKEKKNNSCVWDGEREREKHINVFRSGLKVLYLIAMYSGVNWRLLRKKKRDGK